jgi:hypothetical protein
MLCRNELDCCKVLNKRTKVTKQLCSHLCVLWKYFQIFIFIISVLKKGALKTQLRFRKVILEQMADKSLFMFSEKGKEHSGFYLPFVLELLF